MYDILRLYVYHDGVRVGMAESADSLQWMPAFDDLGEFKLVCAATETNRALLVLDAVLYNPDTPGLAAVVLAVEADGDNHRMTVRGKFSLCLFKRRTARGSRTITDGAAGLLEICRTNLRAGRGRAARCRVYGPLRGDGSLGGLCQRCRAADAGGRLWGPGAL